MPTYQLQVNGKPYPVDRLLSVRELLEQLAVRVDYVAVEVNAELVPRGEHAQRMLSEGDSVEVVTLVGGG